MLAAHRVIDLTNRDGWMAGYLLAQLGADVVLAEPPGGYERDPWFESYNRGKRSVIADTLNDRLALAVDADLVIANGAPEEIGFLAGMREANPTLITLGMTPFGEDGPKAGWLDSDLTMVASSGQMAVTGDADRPPVRTSLPQAWMHACSEGVVGALIALHERAASGLGQHVDLSVQASMMGAALPSYLYPASGMPLPRRAGGGVMLGSLQVRWVYPAADGYVVVSLLFGPMGGPFTTRFIEFMHREGMAREETLKRDYVDFGLKIQSGEYTLDDFAEIMDEIAAFTATKTKAELAAAASELALLVVPVADLDDVLANPQLEARGYWDHVDGVRHPGAMVKASATPLRTLPAAPAPGEHQGDIARRGPAPQLGSTPPSAGAKPLAGVKVLDLAWVAAMPLGTRILAHWGATVVRIESEHRPDILRASLGHKDDIPEQDNAIAWHAVNAGKLGLALDLRKPAAIEVVRELAGWADVVVDSFTPGTMARMGIGYEDLSRVNPSIIMMSSSVMGQTGPLAGFAGFGNLAAAVAGFFDITGWPDRAPAGPYMAYTDFTSPRFSIMALLAALDHRRRTGEGQFLDFSQMEAATHLLSPALYEMQGNGEALTRRGNLDPDMSPHGVYPAAGEDRWIAVAIATDDQWRSFCTEARREDLADLTGGERIARRAELDQIVSGWTKPQDAAGLAARLQAHGIPAHHVADATDTFTDPQLNHRGQFEFVDHPYARRALVDNPPYLMSRSRGSYEFGGPTYGQHAMDIFGDILGYDSDRITDLAIAEVLE